MKIELPTQLHEKHHLLFSFYHVTCDINAKTNAKRKEALETPGEMLVDLEPEFSTTCIRLQVCCVWSFPLFGILCFVNIRFLFLVGYSWLPLLKEGRLSSQEFSIPVSCNLPPGYLAIKEASNTKVRERRKGALYLYGAQIVLNTTNVNL